MSINMSYCRYENTANALEEILDHPDFPYDAKNLSKTEQRNREKLFELCYSFVDAINEYEFEEDVEEEGKLNEY